MMSDLEIILCLKTFADSNNSFYFREEIAKKIFNDKETMGIISDWLDTKQRRKFGRKCSWGFDKIVGEFGHGKNNAQIEKEFQEIRDFIKQYKNDDWETDPSSV